MSQFDILVLMLLGVSAAVGFFRGAVREVGVGTGGVYGSRVELGRAAVRVDPDHF